MHAITELLMDHVPSISGPVESCIVFGLGAVIMAAFVCLMCDRDDVAELGEIEDSIEIKGE